MILEVYLDAFAGMKFFNHVPLGPSIVSQSSLWQRFSTMLPLPPHTPLTLISLFLSISSLGTLCSFSNSQFSWQWQLGLGRWYQSCNDEHETGQFGTGHRVQSSFCSKKRAHAVASGLLVRPFVGLSASGSRGTQGLVSQDCSQNGGGGVVVKQELEWDEAAADQGCGRQTSSWLKLFPNHGNFQRTGSVKAYLQLKWYYIIVRWERSDQYHKWICIVIGKIIYYLRATNLVSAMHPFISAGPKTKNPVNVSNDVTDSWWFFLPSSPFFILRKVNWLFKVQFIPI